MSYLRAAFLITCSAIVTAVLAHLTTAWTLDNAPKFQPAALRVDDSAVLVERGSVEPDGTTPDSARRLAKSLVVSRGWNQGGEWKCLKQLWQAESGWRHTADNPNSTAYGIAQVLRTPQDLTPKQQIRRGLRYIVHRYDTPCNAWDFWQENAWY